MKKDDTIAAYRDFTKWCKENPSFDLDTRLHTHSGRIGDGGYISDETTRIAFAAWRAAIKADRQQRSGPVAWHTEDHLTDKSATTYDPVVAERWIEKGWPVTPLYYASQPADPAHEPINNATYIYNSGYMVGHHDTVEGQFTDILSADMDTYHADVVRELVVELRGEEEWPMKQS